MNEVKVPASAALRGTTLRVVVTNVGRFRARIRFAGWLLRLVALLLGSTFVFEVGPRPTGSGDHPS